MSPERLAEAGEACGGMEMEEFWSELWADRDHWEAEAKRWKARHGEAVVYIAEQGIALDGARAEVDSLRALLPATDEASRELPTGEDLASAVEEMWKADPKVRELLADSRINGLSLEQVAEMFYGVGAFAMLKRIALEQAKRGPKAAP